MRLYDFHFFTFSRLVSFYIKFIVVERRHCRAVDDGTVFSISGAKLTAYSCGKKLTLTFPHPMYKNKLQVGCIDKH